eukprot:TRINITY_DN23802_c1_g1_i2.p1 TRINITY_DN23802_c1_g1~~TRINITY_DN23802_c1_g1_i2.p1  ORF type:complete len:115 (-),score=0.02 TRINITY_DN23802_c1_g1_i2:308-652(-)
MIIKPLFSLIKTNFDVTCRKFSCTKKPLSLVYGASNVPFSHDVINCCAFGFHVYVPCQSSRKGSFLLDRQFAIIVILDLKKIVKPNFQSTLKSCILANHSQMGYNSWNSYWLPH